MDPINLSFKSYKYIKKDFKRNIKFDDKGLIAKKSPKGDSFCYQTGKSDSSINCPSQESSNPTLKKGQMLDYDGEVFNFNFTEYCRDDIKWVNFGKYLKENFKTLDNVDIYCFGCSTGEEAYSLALLLKKYFNDGDFTINASDIMEDIIDFNTKNKTFVRIDGFIFDKIKSELKLSEEETKKYFTSIQSVCRSYCLKSSITNCVKFKQGNILDSIDNINQNRKSIIMCRNMWPYIDSKEYGDFAKKLYEKLAPGSIVAIGSFDCLGHPNHFNSATFPDELIKSGFKAVPGRIYSFLCKTDGKSLIYKKE